MTVEYTSSMRGVIAKMWIEPERDINKFLNPKCNNNYNQIKRFVSKTICVPEDEIEDFIMDYHETLVRLVWPTEEIDGKRVSTSTIFYDKDDSDQEFLRRVKNRLWSFCTYYNRKKLTRPNIFVSLNVENVSNDGDEDQDYTLDISSGEDLEKSYIGNQILKSFIEEFEQKIRERTTHENKEDVVCAAKRIVLEGMYNKEAIAGTSLRVWEFGESSRLIEEILKEMKPNYV